MSDAVKLAPIPITWRHADRDWLLAPRSLDAELLFQARHEAWAVQRLDARRGLIGEESYQQRVAAQSHAMDANRFAFGGALSLEWLTTREGMVEYVSLLMQEGQLAAKMPPMPRAAIDRIARGETGEDKESWERLSKAVIRRDFRAEFPKLIAAWDAEDALAAKEAQPSPSQGTATPSPSTTASS